METEYERRNESFTMILLLCLFVPLIGIPVLMYWTAKVRSDFNTTER